MSKALIKYLRLSPTKARLIAREIQGMNAELAMASLKFMPNKGAKFIANAISSAVANGGFEANEVEVLSCRVDAGAVLKRFQPRARGSASRIRKPTSHILVIVGKAEDKKDIKKSAKPKKAQNSSEALNSSKNSASKNSSKNSKNSNEALNLSENSSPTKAENATKAKSTVSSKVENSSKGVNSSKKAQTKKTPAKTAKNTEKKES